MGIRMESYYIKSIIGEIAKGIEKLICKGSIIKDRKIILYGLDRYSFAMRTILSNLGYSNIEGYISDDEASVMRRRTEIENFACRYLNSERDVVNVWTIHERLLPFDDTVRILMAAKEYEVEKEKLKDLGYQEGVHFYIVYDFQEKEINQFLKKMTVMSLDEVKQAEKELLRQVDIFCRENSIRYWVCGGTLLGTIRHKGFIPWDDDIDIFMPWRDYLRFIELFQESPHYGLTGFGAAEEKKLPNAFLKVIDKQTVMDVNIETIREIAFLFIDVFPLIGMPENIRERSSFFMEYQELNRQIWQDFYAANGNLNVFSKWTDRQRNFMEKYDFDSSSYVGVLGTAYGERDCTCRNIYNETIRMPFENIEVNVAKGYVEYLDNLYGKDWMQLPDVEKRKSHHHLKFYWRGTNESDYNHLGNRRQDENVSP